MLYFNSKQNFLIMKQKLLLASFILMTGGLLSSCGRCGGCDDIYTTVGAELGAFPTIDLNIKSSAILSVSSDMVITRGTRRCGYKNLVRCNHDSLDTKKMKLVCDKDLLLQTEFIAAGVDLLSVPTIRDKDDRYGNRLQIDLLLEPGESFPAGDYRFIVAGSTADGKAFTDTTSILFTR
jgi:hypothetical protein